MKRLYDENLFRFEVPQESYWEATADDISVDASALARDDACDVAIIGGGYTGLSAAYHLAKDFNIDVRVVDAGHIGWGASGRNGGFCCTGGYGLDTAGLIRQFGVDAVREYCQASARAIGLVRELGEAEAIDFDAQGDAELIVAHTEKAFDGLQGTARLETEQLGLDRRLFSAAEFRERFWDSKEQHGAVQYRPAFGLHPLRYCKGLANAAVRHGARLHPYSEVQHWEKTEDGVHRLSTSGGTLRARRIIMATNGFMPEALHAAFGKRTLPVISAIVVTRPLTVDELAAQNWQTEQPSANSRRILNYFRVLPDRRFMFGGRSYGLGDAGSETETYSRLQAQYKRMWPGWSEADVEYAWQGLVCFTARLSPAVGRLDEDPSVFFGFGYHGNGVSTATWMGAELARLVATGDDSGLPAIVRGLSKKFPLAALRTKYLRAGIALSAWLDQRG